MIIGIDASRANRDHKSGTEWYSYYLIKYFARIDSENQYILYTDKPLKDGLLDLTYQDLAYEGEDNKPEYDKDGYQIIKSPYNNFKACVLHWPFHCFWTLGRLSIKMIFDKPDILFVPAHTLPLIHPKKTINTIHDVSFRNKENGQCSEDKRLGPSRSLFLRSVVNFLVRIFTCGKYSSGSLDYFDWSVCFALKHASKILTVSNFSRENILKIYSNCGKKDQARNEKLKVVHNGFANFLYKKDLDESKVEEVLVRNGIKKPYILYIGKLENKKNTPLLIEAFAKVRYLNKNIKEKLVLAGNASFGYDEVKYIINEYHLEEDVSILGWLNEINLAYIVHAATAFIFPSRQEGFGIPILQAMNSGVPLVISDIPVFHEIADGAALFFNPARKEDLAEAIEKIITDEPLRQALIEKGLERAKDFSWEKCARETLQEILSA